MSNGSDGILLDHYRLLANDFRNRNLRGLVASMVTGTSVLDIGCGSGHLLRSLQDQGKDVVGLESSGELVDLAQALHGPLRIEHGSPEDIDGWRHRFDTITIIGFALCSMRATDLSLFLLSLPLKANGQR